MEVDQERALSLAFPSAASYDKENEMNLWDVYIMAENRVVTIVSNVAADDKCDALREAGVALMARKNVSQLLFKTGKQLEAHQDIFAFVPHSCIPNKYVTLRAVTNRKVAI